MAECQEELTLENVSDEDKTKSCDSCTFRGFQNPADTYCPVCADYLCISCKEAHRSFKATREHDLVRIGEPEEASDRTKCPVTNVMICDIHQSEYMAEYCVTHKKAICRLCKTTKHRKCDTKDLREVSEEKKNSVEFFLEDIKELLSEFEKINSSRQNDKCQLFEATTIIRANIKKIKEEIVIWAEKLEKEAKKELEKVENETVSKIDSHIAVTEDMINQLIWVKTAFEKIGSNGIVEAFVLKAKIEQQIQEGREVEQEIMKEITPVTCNFRKSDKLSRLTSEISSLGTIETVDRFIDFKDISKVTKKRDIAVESTIVTGCAFLPNGHLVICDYSNKTVNVFTPDFKLKDGLNCGSKIWDVAVLSIDEVIVTKPTLKCLEVLNVSETVRAVKSIPVGEQCWGVEIKKDRIYISCHLDNGKGGNVKVLTLDGVCVNTFRIDGGYLYYLAVNGAGDRIIVSIGNTSKVFCIDVKGNTIFTYSDSQMTYPLGLSFDSHDNFMVCGNESNNVHVVKKDETKHKILLSSDVSLRDPYCLAYRPTDKTLVVGQGSSKSLIAFSIDI